MRVLGYWAMAAVSAGAVWPAEVLTDFRPSAVETAYGTASEVDFSTEAAEVEAGSLAQHLSRAMKDFRFGEPVWVIRYKTEIQHVRVRDKRENYLCHTFFADQRVVQREEDEFRGIYSDAFTPEVILPDGFGILLSAGENLHWMPMFNNRGEEPVRVAMKVAMTVIRAKDLKKPLRPLYANLRSVQVPHLFFVPPGRDERESTFQLPFEGRIHFMGTHVHPYGISVELYNVSRKELVWKGMRKGDPAGSPMTVYSSVEGYPIRAGETFRVRSVYENPTGSQIDAMAGIFLLYSRK
jgi:hypothetical protein